MNSKTFSKPKSKRRAARKLSRAHGEKCVLKNMAKNKSPTFHNLSWEPREKIVYFPLKKARGKVLLLTQLTPTSMPKKGRGGGIGEWWVKEHVIKTFTHEEKNLVNLFWFFQASRKIGGRRDKVYGWRNGSLKFNFVVFQRTPSLMFQNENDVDMNF